MLARTLGPKYDRWPCYGQPKLNGVRALYQNGDFQSRDEKIWGPIFQHMREELRGVVDVIVKGLILDGELYVHGWRLQRINGAIAVNRKEPCEDTRSVEFHVFDVVDPNRNFSSRWFELYHGLADAGLEHVKAVPTILLQNRSDMDNHFKHYTSLGYEGIILRPDGPYEFGEHDAKSGPARKTSYRSTYLWKYKSWTDDEFVCVGVTEGEGKADIGIGALKLLKHNPTFFWSAYRDLPFQNSEVFKVGTGFDDTERIQFFQTPPIGKLVKIRYLCLTADGIPFNPSFLCVME